MREADKKTAAITLEFDTLRVFDTFAAQTRGLE